MKANTIEMCKSFALNNGWICLSETYFPKCCLKLQCQTCNYMRNTSFKTFQKTTKCKNCNEIKRNISKLQQINDFVLNNFGGKCISEEYNADQKMHWQCSLNHKWWALVSNIKAKHWCPACAKQAKITMDDVHELAASRDGKCLSEQITNARTVLEWICSLGHTWFSTYDNIKRKYWCPECENGLGEKICRYFFQTLFEEKFIKCRPDWLKNPKTGYNLELDGYCAALNLAFEHHGEQHYKCGKFQMTQEDFEYLQWKDNIKKEMCEIAGVKLIIIPQLFHKTKLGYLQTFILEQSNVLKIKIPETFEKFNLSSIKYIDVIRLIK